MTRKFLLLGLLFVSFTALAWAGRVPEAAYVEHFCGGIVEYRLNDGTRVDCLSPEAAFEYDFSYKWAEAIGQSMHYSNKTGRAPGIVLITNGTSASARHIDHVCSVIERWCLKTVVYSVERVYTENELVFRKLKRECR